jgi:hypothetical protein
MINCSNDKLEKEEVAIDFYVDNGAIRQIDSMWQGTLSAEKIIDNTWGEQSAM